MYLFIEEIPKERMVQYTVFLYGFIYMIHQWKPTIQTWISICVGLVLLYLYETRERSKTNNYQTKKFEQLNEPYLKQTEFLYQDPELIEFLSSIREYRVYNPYHYLELVTKVDDLLRLERDMKIGIAQSGQQYELAEQLQEMILNLFHSFLYRLPHSPSTMDKFHTKMDELKHILQTHMTTIYRTVQYKQREEGIHRFTKWIYPNHPKGISVDSIEPTSFDYFSV